MPSPQQRQRVAVVVRRPRQRVAVAQLLPPRVAAGALLDLHLGRGREIHRQPVRRQPRPARRIVALRILRPGLVRLARPVAGLAADPDLRRMRVVACPSPAGSCGCSRSRGTPHSAPPSSCRGRSSAARRAPRAPGPDRGRTSGAAPLSQAMSNACVRPGAGDSRYCCSGLIPATPTTSNFRVCPSASAVSTKYFPPSVVKRDVTPRLEKLASPKSPSTVSGPGSVQASWWSDPFQSPASSPWQATQPAEPTYRGACPAGICAAPAPPPRPSTMPGREGATATPTPPAAGTPPPYRLRPPAGKPEATATDAPGAAVSPPDCRELRQAAARLKPAGASGPLLRPRQRALRSVTQT